MATIALLKGIMNFGSHEGVRVTDFASAMGLASALLAGVGVVLGDGLANEGGFGQRKAGDEKDLEEPGKANRDGVE